jgi:hypothetical protein
MEIFPYISKYLLGFTGLTFICLLVIPAPYGKFSKTYFPLQMNSRLAWFLCEVGGLFILLPYYENESWNATLPNTNKGWAAFTFILVHFMWRSIFSQVILEYIDPPRGTKETSVLIPLGGILYLPLVGMNFRHMVVEIDDTMQIEDGFFLGLSTICLCANGFVDVMLNILRKKKPEDKYLGSYLSREDIADRFALLSNIGIDSPNYFFEILEWGFFVLFAWRWEAFWWFISTLVFLIPRMIWTSHWYTLNKENQLSNSVRIPGALAESPNARNKNKLFF